jgi:glycosyltransferase involved in cell wall biosynthesis
MNHRKKFCFVLPSFINEGEIGGSEIQAFLIAQQLLQRGWSIHYIREKNQKIGRKEDIDGIRIHSLPQRHTKLKWLNIKPLFQLMREIQADVWYCRGTISYIYPVWRNARRIGGKIIWSCSSDRFLYKRYFRELKNESLLRKIAARIDRYLFLKTIRKIDLFILQSHKQKELLEHNWRLKGEVIYNGYPIIPLPIGQREPAILWIGRLQQSKHPERYISLVKKFAEKSYRFYIMGREVEPLGFAQEFSILEKECATFKYLGEIEQEEVFRWYERSRLLINTSDYEGFSNTFIEAWLHGVPVISLKVDPDGLIQKNGLGTLSLSMNKLAIDVELLLEDHDLWQKTSMRCRDFAVKNFNIVDKVTQLEKQIEKLFGRE